MLDKDGLGMMVAVNDARALGGFAGEGDRRTRIVSNTFFLTDDLTRQRQIW